MEQRTVKAECHAHGHKPISQPGLELQPWNMGRALGSHKIKDVGVKSRTPQWTII